MHTSTISPYVAQYLDRPDLIRDMTREEIARINMGDAYSTLHGFLSTAVTADTPQALSNLCNALRKNRTPFRSGTPNYKRCFDALFKRANQCRWRYVKGVGVAQPFQA